jgi:hypothetical protein
MADFAPGIPKKNRIGSMADLPTDAILTLVRQRHAARRAGLHEDLRIGSPSGLYSWAVPKFLPEDPGVYRLAIQQPIHQYSYKDFEGHLPPGYGEGDVSKIEESPVVVLRREPNVIEFTRGTSKDSKVYRMFRTGKNWLITVKQPGQPDVVADYQKEHLKSVPIDQVQGMIDQGATVAPKIDGAGVLAYLGKHGVDVYGIRPDKSGLKPDYTAHIGGLSQIQVPEDLQGTMLRGEIYGVRNGAVVPPNELSGYLNSTLVNAIDKRRKGLRLLVAALAVNKGKDDYGAPVGDIVRRLHSPSFTAMQPVGGTKARRLLNSIMKGRNPLTGEGVVVHQQGKRPLKAKLLDDYDVVVHDVFPADTKGTPRAGGFGYALPDQPDKAVGRVGTGFDHQMLKDMLANPDSYIGRTARIRSQGQYDTGAYRAPSFLAMKED